MTTTTGKPAGWPRHALPRLAPLAVAAMLLAGECRADWRIQPSIALKETYSDNVSRREDAREQAFVTEISPGLTLIGKGRRFEITATGQARQFAYSNGNAPHTANRVYDYALDGRGQLVDDLLFIEASTSSSPTNISAFGQLGNNSPYALDNRTQIKTWRISPYLVQRFGSVALLSARYTRDSVKSDLDRFANSSGDSVSASLASGRAFDTLGWGLSYMRQDLDSKISGKSASESAIGNLRYALNKRLWLTASVGYDRYDYQALGGRTEGRNWSAGFDWTPSTRSRLNAEIGRHYFGQTGKLLALHRSRYTAWTLSYDDLITTSRQQFLLPSTIDTVALLDRLFSASIADPVLRQQAVADYIQQTGLPPSLADSVNYLSNRYLRDKRLQASGAFTKGHSSAILSVYRSERIALSDQRSDSDLLGSQLANLNDNVRQKGVSLTYNYRVNTRTNVLAAALYARSLSLTTGFESDTRDLSIGLTRQLGKALRAAVELRNSRGAVGPTTGHYRENALAASLTVQL